MLLILCGCAASPQGNPPPGVAAKKEVTTAASFSQEDGTVLYGGTARLLFGESYVDYPLDDGGELNISGLPRVGDLMLTVFDQQEQVQGAITLSEGSVIDASTDGSGVGHITLKKDTDEIALLFIQKDDGCLLCALRLP